MNIINLARTYYIQEKTIHQLQGKKCEICKRVQLTNDYDDLPNSGEHINTAQKQNAQVKKESNSDKNVEKNRKNS